jgi:hydroxymethylbilane synthase
MQGKKTLRIGTRGSNLALYQANAVKSALEKVNSGYDIEIRIIKTRGDRILNKSLSKIGDKGLFTKELENELSDGTIDMAVHSLKDLPTYLPEGMKIGAVLPRGEFRDVLVSKDGRKLKDFGKGDTFATSSLRRRAALLAINREFRIVDIRGNVETRLKKMYNGHCDAIVMAGAGLQRLGLESQITEIIDPTIILPAVSQGAIAIEVMEDPAFQDNLLSLINHVPTSISIQAERSFLHNLQGGCQVPIGCYSRLKDQSITLTGCVASLSGSVFLKETLVGSVDNPLELGRQLAENLKQLGAEKILNDIRDNLTHSY